MGSHRIDFNGNNAAKHIVSEISQRLDIHEGSLPQPVADRQSAQWRPASEERALGYAGFDWDALDTALSQDVDGVGKLDKVPIHDANNVLHHISGRKKMRDVSKRRFCEGFAGQCNSHEDKRLLPVCNDTWRPVIPECALGYAGFDWESLEIVERMIGQGCNAAPHTDTMFDFDILDAVERNHQTEGADQGLARSVRRRSRFQESATGYVGNIPHTPQASCNFNCCAGAPRSCSSDSAKMLHRLQGGSPKVDVMGLFLDVKQFATMHSRMPDQCAVKKKVELLRSKNIAEDSERWTTSMQDAAAEVRLYKQLSWHRAKMPWKLREELKALQKSVKLGNAISDAKQFVMERDRMPDRRATKKAKAALYAQGEDEGSATWKSTLEDASREASLYWKLANHQQSAVVNLQAVEGDNDLFFDFDALDTVAEAAGSNSLDASSGAPFLRWPMTSCDVADVVASCAGGPHFASYSTI